MHLRGLTILPAIAAVVVVPVGLAAAHDGPGRPTSGSTASVAPVTPRLGASSAAGWGSTYEAPRPGSGIDTTKLIPGLTATYGAATGGMFSSPPTDPASGYVAEDATHQPPTVGEIHSFLASDGHVYYRVVNRTATGVTYSP